MAVTTRNTILGLLLLVAALFLGGCVGTVHKVGDSNGWTMMGVNYARWASTKSFQVGDSLAFEYNKDYHDVNQVTLQDFLSCHNSSALGRFGTGSDSVNLTRPGHYYFICGVPGHCQAGQKLDVLVLPASLHPALHPVVSPSGSSPSPANAPQGMMLSPHNAAFPSSRVWIASSLLALVLAAGLIQSSY